MGDSSVQAAVAWSGNGNRVREDGVVLLSRFFSVLDLVPFLHRKGGIFL